MLTHVERPVTDKKEAKSKRNNVTQLQIFRCENAAKTKAREMEQLSFNPAEHWKKRIKLVKKGANGI